MEASGPNPTRRNFLTRVVPVSALACFGCKNFCGLLSSAYAQEAAPHKFTADSRMSFAEVFDLSFKYYYIPTLQGLRDQVGDGDFIAMLKRASEQSGRSSAKGFARNLPENDFESFKSWARQPDRFWQHALTFEIVEDSDTALEVKITECLWAKTFREMEASDIGYAGICHGDFAYAEGFNPKLRMERTKTLMQGDDRCNHRWLWEA
jgi:predicted hydrocarbon binding protein